MDAGLIVSILAAVAAAEGLTLFRPAATMPGGPTDVGLVAAVVGVVVGRMSALALDHPTSLFVARDVGALRGGVEFWPGVAAGAVVVTVAARRQGVAVGRRLADLAPYGLMAVAGYQATCFVREGCFGPSLPVGLSPDGLHPPQFPVEVAGALVLTFVAVVLTGQTRRLAPFLIVVLAVWALAVQRAVSSFWLPVVGDGLSRPHRESIVIAGAAGLVLIGWVARDHLRRVADAETARAP